MPLGRFLPLGPAEDRCAPIAYGPSDLVGWLETVDIKLYGPADAISVEGQPRLRAVYPLSL
jgi:hypothetical protein